MRAAASNAAYAVDAEAEATREAERRMQRDDLIQILGGAR